MIKELSTKKVKTLYQNGFTPKYLSNANIKIKNSHWFVLFKEEIPVGIAQIKLSKEPLYNFPNKKNLLLMISVKEEFKGKGIGKKLITHIMDFLREKKEKGL